MPAIRNRYFFVMNASATIRQSRLLSALYRGVSWSILSRVAASMSRVHSRIMASVSSRWNWSPRVVW